MGTKGKRLNPKVTVDTVILDRVKIENRRGEEDDQIAAAVNVIWMGTLRSYGLYRQQRAGRLRERGERGERGGTGGTTNREGNKNPEGRDREVYHMWKAYLCKSY
jgi:hypothetical protein